MTMEEQAKVESKAAMAGYPVHLLVLPVPVACLVGLLVTDLIFLITATEFWSQVSLWLGTGGLVTGFVASAFGLVDFARVDQFRQQEAGWRHALSSTALLVLTGVNVYLRVNDPAAGVLPWGLALSGLGVALLALSANYGGQLSRYWKRGVAQPLPATVRQAVSAR